MIFIPLGFGKLPGLPIISLMLILGMIVISVPFFKKVDGAEKAHREAIVEFDYQNKIDELLKERCRVNPQSDCEATRKVASIVFQPETPTKKDFAKVIRDMKGADSFKEFETLVKKVKTLTKSPDQFPDDLKALQGYSVVRDAYTEIQNRKNEYGRKNHFLSLKLLSPGNLLLAEFTHGNWMHLIGNLVVFFAMAFVLEARVNVGVFLLIYFLGGSIGMITQLYLAGSEFEFLMGASANISAVIGASLVYFYRTPLRCLFSLVFYNKIIECPTWLILPAIFFLGDVSGVLSEGDGVAHIAHMSAFISGAMMALIFKQFDGIGDAYLSIEEKRLHQRMKLAKVSSAKLQIAEKILGYNAKNFVVIEESLDLAVKNSESNVANTAFLKKFFSSATTLMLERNSHVTVDRWLKSWSASIPSIEALNGIGMNQLNALAQRQLKMGNWFEAARLLDALRFYFSGSPSADVAGRNLSAIFAHLKEKQTDFSLLETYFLFEKKTTLKKIFSQMEIANV